MTDRKLMQQALDAMQYASDQTKPENLHGCDCLICKTILALRDRLAQPEQEPVAWRFGSGTWLNREVHWRYIDTLEGAEGLRGLEPLYATPPQRQWVGLTPEEREECIAWSHDLDSTDYSKYLAKMVEYKLKEKNNGQT
jgi:hypothetical protein